MHHTISLKGAPLVDHAIGAASHSPSSQNRHNGVVKFTSLVADGEPPSAVPAPELPMDRHSPQSLAFLPALQRKPTPEQLSCPPAVTPPPETLDVQELPQSPDPQPYNHDVNAETISSLVEDRSRSPRSPSPESHSPRPPPLSTTERMSTPPPPPPKVKMSLKDFAMRRKKQKEEEMASASAKPTEVSNARGNYVEPTQMGVDEGDVAPMTTSCKPTKVAVVTRSHSSEPTCVAMALCDQETPSSLPLSELSLPAPNGTIGNAVGATAQCGSQIDDTRTPESGISSSSPQPKIKDDEVIHSTLDLNGRDFKAEAAEAPSVKFENPFTIKESFPRPPLNGLYPTNNRDPFGTITSITRSSSPPTNRRPLHEDGEITSIPPPRQPTAFAPRAHTPPTQPRSFNVTPNSPPFSIGSPSGPARRPSQPPTARPSIPSSRPPPIGPRALRTQLGTSSAYPLNRPLAGSQLIPRGPSADRDRLDWDRDRSWSGHARPRGRGTGGGWGR